MMIAGAAMSGVPASAVDLPGKGRTVRPGRAAWDTFWFGGLIIQGGLEKLGYKIAEPKTLDTAVLYQSLSQGDVDFTADIIMPLARSALDKIRDTVTLAGTVIQTGSVSGLLIDKATADKHNILYIEDFQDPNIAAVFSAGDGRARLVGPNPGWDDEATVRDLLKKSGVDKTVNMAQGEYNILVADTVSRFKAGRPVMIYAWYPNTATIPLKPGRDLVWLQVKPEHQDPAITVKGMPGCTQSADPCNTGSSPSTYMIAANSKFCEANPVAKKFFSLVKMTLEDRVEQNSKMMIEGEKSDADLKRHAAEWIKKNQKAFDGWIEASLAAK